MTTAVAFEAPGGLEVLDRPAVEAEVSGSVVEVAVGIRPMGESGNPLSLCALAEIAEDMARVPESAKACPDPPACAWAGVCIWECGRK